MPEPWTNVLVHADTTFRVPMPRGAFIVVRMADSRERALDVTVQVSAPDEAAARAALAAAVESLCKAFS